jgi:hypothetical protein
MFKLAKTPASVVIEINLFTTGDYHEGAEFEVHEEAQRNAP